MYASGPLEPAFQTKANILDKHSKGVDERKAQEKGTYGGGLDGKSQFRGRGRNK